MPTFQFTSPDGKNYSVDGPEGATKEQAFAMLQTHLGTPAPAAPPATLAAPAPAPGLATRAAQAVVDSPLVNDNPLVGAAEKVTQGVTGLASKAVGGIAGLGHMATNALGLTHGEPADTVRSIEQAGTYQPRTYAAGAIDTAVGAVKKPFDAAAAPLDRAVDAAGPGVRTFAPAAAEAATDLLGLAGPGGAAAKGAEAAPAVVEGAGKVAGATPLEVARSAGFKFRPSDAEMRNPGESIPGRSLENFAGSKSAQRAKDTAANAARTAQLAREDMGLPAGSKIAPADFDKAMEPHGATYDTTGETLGSFKATPQLASDLKTLNASADPKTALPPKVASRTEQLVNMAENGQLAGPQVVKDISWLRANKGRSVADALESEMERQLADKAPDQLQAFQDARTGFAKVYDYKDATKGGLVDPQALARLDKRTGGNRLTGHAKIIATVANELPGVMKLPGVARDAPGGLIEKVLPAALHVGTAGVSKLVQKGARALSDRALAEKLGRPATDTEASYFKDFGKRQPAGDFKPPADDVPEPKLLGGPTAYGTPGGEVGLGTALTDRGLTPDVRRAAPAHPGTARPATPATLAANRPLALPAPGQETVPGAPPVAVTPGEVAGTEGQLRDVGLTPDVRRAGKKHPGQAPNTDQLIGFLKSLGL